MTLMEINGEYEKETGAVIAETFEILDPDLIPAVLVHSMDRLCVARRPKRLWLILFCSRELPRWHGRIYSTIKNPMLRDLLNRYFFRKHGKGAYYGQ